jgi:hypothetical protein
MEAVAKSAPVMALNMLDIKSATEHAEAKENYAHEAEVNSP